MARKDILVNRSMFTSPGADMSQSSTVSNYSNVQNMDNIGIIVSWTGTSPNGTMTVDCSNDYNPNVGNSTGTWVSLDFGSTISITGNSGTHQISINELPYAWIRITYTKSSGTGTLNAYLTAKQVGG